MTFSLSKMNEAITSNNLKWHQLSMKKIFLKKMIDTKNCQNKLTTREEGAQAWERGHGGNTASLLEAWVKI